MIDIEEAYDILFAHVRPGSVVEIDLSDALHHTLAKPIHCDVDYPPFDRSSMDGYAVRSDDVSDAPVALTIVGQIPAGVTWSDSLGEGQAVQINTGAPLPDGADAVVRVEDTELVEDGARVRIKVAVAPEKFITRRATYIVKGQTVLESGMRLTATALAAAATAGAARPSVYKRPTVAILGTGDELIAIDKKPQGAQIRNSNQYLLEALIRSADATPQLLGVARDDRDALRERIDEALHADAVCITGGISMGAFDFVPEVLEMCGATVRIRKLTIKPGRPTMFATGPHGTPVFALPGNPGGAYVAFELLVRPALAVLQGRPAAAPQTVSAMLRGQLASTSDRRTYIPARVSEEGQDHRLEAGATRRSVTPLSWHGSGDSIGLASATALIVRPPNAAQVRDGEDVAVHVLETP